MTHTRTIAYFGSPHLGGTYTVYRQLREGLRASGWSVRWVGLGREAALVARRAEWAADWRSGEVVAAESVDEREQAIAFLNHIETLAYDAVFTNVLANRVQTNAVRYLDSRITRIMIVHSISPGTYAAARAIRDHVHATVGVSPRIRDDLVFRYGFPRERTQVIPSAFDGAVFERVERKARPGPLRLLSLGRLDDDSKGLFWLPDILRALGELPFILTVAGEGRDGDELRSRLSCYSDRVRFVGALSPREVATVMAQNDVFLLTSRYEGQAITLVEALASGCVPVASHLRGVTDFVVENGKTGFLFPVGDTETAAKFVRALSCKREMLAQMSCNARAAAFARFHPDAMAATYGGLIGAMATDRRSIASPLNREQWRLPLGLRPGLRTFLPSPVKNRLRQMKERWAS